MRYVVEISDLAKAEIDASYSWWLRNRSYEQATRWLDEISLEISSIGSDPLRHPLIRESILFPFELREMLFGIGSRPTHRVVFRIHEKTIEIYWVKHVSQNELSPPHDPGTP